MAPRRVFHNQQFPLDCVDALIVLERRGLADFDRHVVRKFVVRLVLRNQEGAAGQDRAIAGHGGGVLCQRAAKDDAVGPSCRARDGDGARGDSREQQQRGLHGRRRRVVGNGGGGLRLVGQRERTSRWRAKRNGLQIVNYRALRIHAHASRWCRSASTTKRPCR